MPTKPRHAMARATVARIRTPPPFNRLCIRTVVRGDDLMLLKSGCVPKMNTPTPEIFSPNAAGLARRGPTSSPADTDLAVRLFHSELGLRPQELQKQRWIRGGEA